MYEPLGRDCIRLLDFGSESGEPALLTMSIHDAPPFYALSYHCGDTTQRHCFRVGDAQLQLTTNLYEYLLEYRARGCRGRLWADQICIDQTNSAEKRQQIPLMGDIYRAARQAFVWFGRPSASVKAALDVLPDLVTLVKQSDLLNPIHSPVHLRRQVAPFREHWPGIHELWSHP